MSRRWLIRHALCALISVAGVLLATLGVAQAQSSYQEHLPSEGPSNAYYVGYVASQGSPLGETGQPTVVEYDAQGEVVGTAAVGPGVLVKSTQEWNSWIERWDQALREFEDAGGSTQALTRGEYDDIGRECLDAEANALSVSSANALSPEIQSVLVVHVAEGLPPCEGYVLARSPLSNPTLRLDGNASLLVNGAWEIQQVSEAGGYFALQTGYFDADASGCPEQAGVPPTLRNLRAFVSCPAGLVQGVYAPVWGAEIETTSQNTIVPRYTSPTGYYQLPYWTYGTSDDWSGDWVSAKLTFARFEPRLPSSRSFYLRKRGAGRTVNFAVDTVQLRAHARLMNDSYYIVPVVDPDYQFDDFTQYSVRPGGARGQDQGLLIQISAQDLRETDVYLYRVADNKLIGERRGMSPNELSGIAVDPGQFPGAEVYPGCLGGACLSFVVVTRGPALSGAGGVSENNAFLPFASRPADGQPGLEPEYPDSPIRTFLRPGDAVKVVAINRSTGYTGTALGKVNVDISGLSVIEPTDASGPDIVIDMLPPNLRVRANRQYEVEYGATVGEARNYIVGFEGSALNTDQLIAIRTEWFAPDGSALPDGLPGLTGRLARVQMGELQAGGPTDAAGQAVGQFSIEPGIKTSVVRLPEEGVEREHYYIHVDGAPLTGSVDFAGRAGISRPDFSVDRVCYYSTGDAQVCREKEADDPALQSRPAQLVPFKVPVYDKTFSEEQRAAFLEQDLEDPGPVYRWPYRPEMQFTVHELQVEDVYRVEEDGTQVSVINDEIPILTSSSGGIDYTLFAPLDNPLSPFSPTVGDIDEDGTPDHRGFGWEFAGQASDPVLSSSDAQELLFEALLQDPNSIHADDFMALRLFQLGDEANVLWEFSTLDFTVSPDEAIEVSADDQVVYLVARVYVGGEPADDNSEVEWTVTQGPDASAVSAPISYTQDGLTAVILRTGTVAGIEWEIRADLTKLLVNGRDMTVPNTRIWTGKMTVVPGSPASVTLTPDAERYTATLVDEVTIEALVKDQHNNPVLAGTPVEWRLPGYGFLKNAEPVTNGNGVAIARVTSGYIQEVQAVQVHAGKAYAQLGVPAQGVTVTLLSTRETVDLANDESALFTVTAVDAFGTPVPDGTPVVWQTSKGKFPPERDGEPPRAVAQDLTLNGRAQIVLDFPERRVGSGLVRVSVAGSSTTKSIDVVTSSPVWLEVDHPLLAGDETPDTLAAVPPIGERFGTMSVEQLEGSPRSVDFFAEANLVVHGLANDVVTLKITKENESDPDYLELSFDGQLGEQQVQVQLDTTGRASGFISSTGAMLDDFQGPFPLVSVEVVNLQSETLASMGIGVAPCRTIVRTEDVLWAALTGEADNAEERAAVMAASALPGIDLGNITLQLGRIMPGGEEPDWVSLGLSTGGLLVDTVPVVGQAASVPIVAVVAILKRLPSGVLRKGIAEMPGEILDDWVVKGVDEAVETAGAQSEFLQAVFALDNEKIDALRQVIASEASFNKLRALSRTYGTRIVDQAAELALLPDFDPRDVERALRLLDEVDDATALTLRSAQNLEPGFEGLARCMKHGVDAGELKIVLTNKIGFATPSYSEAMLLKDLGTVADVKGVDVLLKSMKSRTIQTLGRRFELEDAVGLRKLGFELEEFSARRAPETWDVDILYRRVPGEDPLVAVQAKSSADALRSLADVEKWVTRAKELLAGRGGGVIEYHLPRGTTLPDTNRFREITEYLAREGIPIRTLVSHAN